MKETKKRIRVENQKKIIFTAGPASLIEKSITNIKPCFGRGDVEYQKTEKKVLNKIKNIAGGFSQIVRFQGSGSLAIEIMMANFLYGKILIIDTGYYAQRLRTIAFTHKSLFKYVKKVESINWKKLDDVENKFD